MIIEIKAKDANGFKLKRRYQTRLLQRVSYSTNQKRRSSSKEPIRAQAAANTRRKARETRPEKITTGVGSRIVIVSLISIPSFSASRVAVLKESVQKCKAHVYSVHNIHTCTACREDASEMPLLTVTDAKRTQMQSCILGCPWQWTSSSTINTPIEFKAIHLSKERGRTKLFHSKHRFRVFNSLFCFVFFFVRIHCFNARLNLITRKPRLNNLNLRRKTGHLFPVPSLIALFSWESFCPAVEHRI